MKYISLLSVMLINPIHLEENLKPDSVFIDVDHAAQRCMTSDCTCRVSLNLTTAVSDRSNLHTRYNVFFREDENAVDPVDTGRIRELLSQNPDSRRFTIVGYTDGCGGSGYNYSLARERALAVSHEISRLRPGSRFTIRAVSEISSGHDPDARRVDIFAGTLLDPGILYTNLRADYYLVDASGSMSTYTSWMRAISQNKNRSSKVFISKASYCYNGQDALSIRPSGATEIWYSLWHVIRLMEPGKRLIVVSDFQSRVRLSSSERATISRIIREKNLQVIGITP